MSLRGSTQCQLATALAFRSSGLTATELLRLVVAQSVRLRGKRVLNTCAPYCPPSPWLYYTTDRPKCQVRFCENLDVTRLKIPIAKKRGSLLSLEPAFEAHRCTTLARPDFYAVLVICNQQIITIHNLIPFLDYGKIISRSCGLVNPEF